MDGRKQSIDEDFMSCQTPENENIFRKVFSTKQMECYNHKTTVENHTSFSSRCCKNTFKIKHNGLNGGHFDKAS